MEITAEALSAQLEKLGRSVKQLEKGGLNRKAIVILLHHHTKISQRTIYTLLEGMEELEIVYTMGDEDA